MALTKYGVADLDDLLRTHKIINNALCGSKDRLALTESLTSAFLNFPCFDCMWLWTCEPGAEPWQLESLSGADATIYAFLDSFDSSMPLATHLKFGHKVLLEWQDIWADAVPIFKESGFQQVGVIPLQSGNKIIGALGFASCAENDFDSLVLDALGQSLDLFDQCLKVLELQQGLLESQMNMDQIFGALDGPLIIVAPDGKILKSNLTSVGIDDKGAGIEALLPGGLQLLKKIREHSPNSSCSGGTACHQSRLIKNNGQAMPVEVIVKEGLWRGLDAYFLNCRDITRQQVMEKERDRLVTAIEQTADSIVITNSSGCIQYTNPAFSKLTGYTAEEVLGANPNILKSSRHDSGFYRQMWATICRGEIWNGRLVNRKKSGEEYWEVASISPVCDTSGIITHYVGVKHDITAELKLEERLRQGQKLEAIGALAGGIAHDFNNILYALLGNSQLALDDIPEGHPAHLPLTEIVKAGDRASCLVAKMMTLGQRAERKKKVSQLEPIITEVMALTRASLPSTIEIRMDLAADCPEILLDEVQIHQVLLNLCTNAAHAMGNGGGILSLQLKHVTVTADTPQEAQEVTAGEYLCLKVIDTGSGMDETLKSRIFEPYYTTKKPDEGTGLGLATVQGIIRNHEGRIFVDSIPNEGSCFTLYFPVASKSVAPLEDKKHEATTFSTEGQSKRPGRVMIVDDEKMIINVVVRGLQKKGFQVRGFTNGREALEVFRKDPDAFDFVITDQTMPGITGFELAAILSSIRPDLPIILSTGYSKDSLESELRNAGVSHFLSKPLRINELSELLIEIKRQEIANKGALNV